MMNKRFCVKLGLYFAPFIAVFVVTAALAFYVGETMPLDMIVNLQMGDKPVLYGLSGTSVFHYKLAAVKKRHPDVLIIGSSRVLQFRSQLLNKNPSAFYNAGGPYWQLAETKSFIEQLNQTETPRILLIGIDQVWFNPDYDLPSQHLTDESKLGLNQLFTGTSDVFRYLLVPRVSRRQLISRQEPVHGVLGLGLTALEEGTGYRNDGSVQVGWLIGDPFFVSREKATFLEALEEGIGVAIPGQVVSQHKLNSLDELLQFAHAENIAVIGFLPPFMEVLYDAMMADGNHTYLPQVSVQVQQVFDRYDFPFFDFSVPDLVGGSDVEMYDGWHPTELMSLRMYCAMLENLPDLLGTYSEPAYLDSVAENANNPVEVFGNSPG